MIGAWIAELNATVWLYYMPTIENIMHNAHGVEEKELYQRKISGDFTWEDMSDKELKRFWGKDNYVDYMEQILRSNAQISLYEMNGIERFADSDSNFYSFKNGHRRTVYLPKNAKRKVYLFGFCTVMGYYVEDKQTIASYLQLKLRNEGYNNYEVVNYGIASKAYWSMMLLTEYAPEDIVIVFLQEGVPLWESEFGKAFYCGSKIETLFENGRCSAYDFYDRPSHCNYLVNKGIASLIFEDIKSNLSHYNYIGEKKKLGDYYISLEAYQYFEEYFEKYNLEKHEKSGAIVMNCNPFTLGHKYLIEYASAYVNWLYIFVVEEDKSYYSFNDRMNMVQGGGISAANVTVVPSGKYVLSKNTFSQYFSKDQVIEIEDMDYDLHIFGIIVAKKLGITFRFVGSEPFDKVTLRYNERMKKILPSYGVNVIEVPRKTIDGVCISASEVRKLINKGEKEKLEKICPASTLNYLYKVYNRYLPPKLIKISIIISVYSTAKYLERCMNAIVGQTLKEFEIIFIINKLSDDVKKILKLYKDKRIVVLSHEDTDKWATKNRGIASAKGLYVMFMDVEDYFINDTVLDNLYNMACKRNVLICGGNLCSDETKRKDADYFLKNEYIHFSEIQNWSIINRYIYNTELLRQNNIFFKEDDYEGGVFFLKAVICAGRLYALHMDILHCNNELVKEKDAENVACMLSEILNVTRISSRYEMKCLHRRCAEKLRKNMQYIYYYLLFCPTSKIRELAETIDNEMNVKLFDVNDKYVNILSNKNYHYFTQIFKHKNALDQVLREYSSIIIYGAGYVGKKVQKYAEENCGVSITEFAVTNAEKEVDDNLVRPIDAYLPRKEEVLIIVGTTYRYQEEIISYLQKLQFKNIFRINADYFEKYNWFCSCE